MFGKKQKQEDASAASAPKEKPKNKKSSSGSSKSGMKNFFLLHAEKMVLGAFALGAAYLVYEGTKTENLKPEQTPTLLKNQSQDTLNSVKAPHWEAIAIEPERKVEDGKFVEMSQKAIVPTDPGPYRLGAWAPAEGKGGKKRRDPKLLAPLALETQSAYGPMASLDKTKPPYLVELDKQKDALPIGKKPKKDDPRPDMRQFKTAFDRGYDGNTASGIGTGVGESSGGLGGKRRSGGSTDDEPPTTKIVKPVVFNCVTALIPHERQWEEFDNVLEESANYDRNRDAPRYLGFEVERVDVTDNPNREIADGDWKPISKATNKPFLEASKMWGGQSTETVQMLFLDQNLSMPIPPVYLRDYRQFSMHSMTAGVKDKPIDFISKKEMRLERERKQKGASGGGQNSSGSSGPPPNMGNRGAPPGLGAGRGAPNMGGGGMGGMGGGGMGGMGGGGMGGGEQGAGMTSASPGEFPNAKYKLIRLYDFEVEPGHVYRYRVRYLLDDPNYPMMSAEPPLNSLEKTVQERVLGLKELDNKREEETKGVGFEKSSSLASQWSTPSAPQRVPHPGLLASGGTLRDVALTEVSVDNTVVRYEESSDRTPGPRINWAFASWDATHAADVIRTPGTSLDLAELGKVVVGKVSSKNPPPSTFNPMSKRISSNPDYVFQEAVTVLSIRPPVELATSNRSKDPLYSPAEILTIDGTTGELRISSELEDYEPFRLYSLADEVEALKGSSGTGPDANNQGGPPGANGGGRPGANPGGKGGNQKGGGGKMGGGAGGGKMGGGGGGAGGKMGGGGMGGLGGGG